MAPTTAFAAPSLALSKSDTVRAVSTCSFMGARVAPRTAARPAHLSRRRNDPSMLIGIVYGSTTGQTEEIAELIKAKLGDKADAPVEVNDCPPAKLAGYDAILAGAPTWNTGDDEQRSGTDWDSYLYDELETADLSGKPVGIFGCGDSIGYGDFFVDAIDELYTCFEKRGAKMIGSVSTDGYSHAESKAERDGKFVGLAIDQVNEDDMSEGRVSGWCAQILKEI